MSTHGLLAPIFHEAAKSGLKITAGGLALVPGANVAAVDDSARKAPAVQFFEDIDWHAMAGKRVTAVRRDLMHPGTHLPILLEALIVRAKESVTLWLSKKSSELRDPCDAPLLHDMLWPERSPVNAILHFCSSVLAGEHKVTRLLSRLRGRASIQHLFRTHPDAVAFIRISFVNASTWSFIRGVARLKRWPWRIAIICDMRRSWEDRLNTALTFMSKKLCCLDKGFCRRLRRRLGNDATLEMMLEVGVLSTPYLDIVWIWLCSVSGTTQDLELRHGRFRRWTCPQSKVPFFIANAVNMETVWNEVTRKHLLALIQDSAQKSIEDQPSQQPEQQPAQQPQRHSSLSALQDLHRECCARDRAMGLTFNPCSKEYWGRVREEFGDLGEAEQERRRVIAGQARAIAHAHRTIAAAAARLSASHPALTDAAPAVPALTDAAPAVPAQGRLRARGDCECRQPDTLPHLAGLQLGIDDLKQFRSGHDEEASHIQNLWRSSVDGLAKDEGDIPASVRAPRMCSGLCKKCAGPNQWSLFCQLQDAMSRIVRRPSMSVDQLKVVLSFQVTVGQLQKDFFAMPTLVFAKGLANTVDSDHCYLPLREVAGAADDEPAVGRLMEFSRCVYHTPAESSIFTEGVSTGALDHMLADDYLASCLPFDSSSVSVVRVPFEWRGADTLVITDYAGEEVLVTLQPRQHVRRKVDSDSDADEDEAGEEVLEEEPAAPELQELLEVAGAVVEEPDVSIDVEEAPEDDAHSECEDWDDAFPDLVFDIVDDDQDAGSAAVAPTLPRQLPDLHVDVRSRHIEWDDASGKVFELVAGGERGRMLGTAKWLGIGGLKCVCALHPKKVSVQGEAKECGFIVPMGPDKIGQGFAACSWFFRMGAAYHVGACISAAKSHHMELISAIKDIDVCCIFPLTPHPPPHMLGSLLPLNG